MHMRCKHSTAVEHSTWTVFLCCRIRFEHTCVPIRMKCGRIFTWVCLGLDFCGEVNSEDKHFIGARRCSSPQHPILLFVDKMRSRTTILTNTRNRHGVIVNILSLCDKERDKMCSTRIGTGDGDGTVATGT